MPSEIVILAFIVIAILVLFWLTKGKSEKYNGGNNIDFRKTETDRNLPSDVISKAGTPFIIINNP